MNNVVGPVPQVSQLKNSDFDLVVQGHGINAKYRLIPENERVQPSQQVVRIENGRETSRGTIEAAQAEIDRMIELGAIDPAGIYIR